MPAHSKLTPEILNKLKELVNKEWNENSISKELGFARGTIKKWCKENNLFIKSVKIQNGNLKKHNIYIEEIKKHGSPKKAAEKSGIKSNGQYLIKKYGLEKYTSGKSIPKLSFKEAQLRLPNQSDKIIGFENGKYTIKTQDNYIYHKVSGKLYQGDPRGKSGIKWTKQKVIDWLDNLGYAYIDGFSRVRDPLRAKCKKCDNIRINRLKNFEKQQCPSCSNNGVSFLEDEINQWIKNFNFNTCKYKFKGKTRGKEIDIYIPSLNLGIEYCGLYWHNENSPTPRGRSYHHDKMKAANENGIRLITIYEDEWDYRKDQVKNYLKSVLGVHEKRVYARKCDVKEVDKVAAKEFLENNHIQGKTTFKVALGLYHEDELLGLVTGNVHHRQKIGEYQPFVLNRLVFANGVQVVGGSSKLLKHLIKYAKNIGYKKLVSWSDNRWSEGNVYEKCGFKLVQHLPPDYSYYNFETGGRESKQSNKKKNLISKGALGTMDNTEHELAKTLNLYRIYDCGKKRWEIDL